jgi:hypothetical protein
MMPNALGKRNHSSSVDVAEIQRFIEHEASNIDPCWASAACSQTSTNAWDSAITRHVNPSTTIVVKTASSGYVLSAM